MTNMLPSSSLKKSLNNGENKDTHSELLVLPPNQIESTVNLGKFDRTKLIIYSYTIFLPIIAWGPFYVRHAPFRAKISPVYAVGVPLIIKGRVFGLDTHQPLAFACIDIWQASPETKYDYHEVDPDVKFEYKNELNTHGRSSNFNYRARLITDEQGRYEYETVKPAAYFDPDDSTWRCPHIHYYVQASGYKPVVTQLYFKGEERNNTGINSLFRL
jgi:protocatechuate 3,4-dioxygenase beta subunit